MSKEERYSNYDSFAWFYEKHWSRETPNQIFAVIEKLLLPRMPSRGRILDLCCGTGGTAAALTERGFRVTGVDGSKEMLRYARRNAPGADFIVSDARSFTLAPVYDGIVSTFDSLNHVLHLKELKRVFRNVHAALADRGLFFLDLIMEEAFLLRWQDYFTIVEEDNICVLNSQYDADQRIGRCDVATFRLNRNAWLRADLVILEKCYSKSEVKTALKESGFDEVSFYYAEKDFGLANQTGRAFILARKNSRPKVNHKQKRKKRGPKSHSNTTSVTH